jgi:NADPH-dependent ferric siderophore reductase
VLRTVPRSASMLRVTLVGTDLVGLERGEPGSSVRLLLPRDDGGFELPTWQGNEFLWADGARARIRTLTPLAVRDDGASAELDLDVVLHDDAPLTRWARSATAGDPAAVSGTGSGYDIDPAVASYVLLGDESAVPAVTTLLEALPRTASVTVLVERRAGAAQVDLPDHPGATVTWSVLPDGEAPGATLVEAAARVELLPEARIWAAGEAAAVQRIRKLLFDQRGVQRSQATIRGYWKAGREGT